MRTRKIIRAKKKPDKSNERRERERKKSVYKNKQANSKQTNINICTKNRTRIREYKKIILKYEACKNF